MIKSIFSLFNLDVFIEPMSLSRSIFSFSFEKTKGGLEWWGLGLHVVASSIQMSPR
jgi:hypothetical protein